MAIVVTVVVVVIVAVVAVVLLQGGAPGGMPVYAGSEAWDIPDEFEAEMPEGASIKGYTTSGVSVQELLNWYKG